MALAHPQWRDARARVLAALAKGHHCIAVVGPPGTGKTTLLNDVARTLVRAAGQRMENTAEPGSPPVLVITSGASGVALVDNGDTLSDAALAALAAPGAPQCVFAGPGELAGRLAGHVPQIEIVPLAPLPPDEARTYLSMWLMSEELSPKLLNREAVAELIARADGVPRLLSELAWRAVRLGSSEGARRITSRHVRKEALLLVSVHAQLRMEPLRPLEESRRKLPAELLGRVAMCGAMAVMAGIGVIAVRTILRQRPPLEMASITMEIPGKLSAPVPARIAVASGVPATRANPANGEASHSAMGPITPPPAAALHPGAASLAALAALAPMPARIAVASAAPTARAILANGEASRSAMGAVAPPPVAALHPAAASLAASVPVPSRIAVNSTASAPRNRVEAGAADPVRSQLLPAAAVPLPTGARFAVLHPTTLPPAPPTGAAATQQGEPASLTAPVPLTAPVSYPVPTALPELPGGSLPAPAIAPASSRPVVPPLAPSLAMAATHLAPAIPAPELATIETAAAGPQNDAVLRPEARGPAMPDGAASNVASLGSAGDGPAALSGPAQGTLARGLLLVVQGSETLGSLYRKVYQGVVPPPFEVVAAANPKHLKPGDILVFPPPPGGWKKQRTAAW